MGLFYSAQQKDTSAEHRLESDILQAKSLVKELEQKMSQLLETRRKYAERKKKEGKDLETIETRIEDLTEQLKRDEPEALKLRRAFEQLEADNRTNEEEIKKQGDKKLQQDTVLKDLERKRHNQPHH